MIHLRLPVSVALSATVAVGSLMMVFSVSQPARAAEQRSNSARDGSLSNSAGCQVMGVTGFLALAGLFTAGVAYKIGASRKQEIAPSQLPSDPEIEHPELRLTTLPREALSDAHLFDQATRTEQEVALTRRR